MNNKINASKGVSAERWQFGRICKSWREELAASNPPAHSSEVLSTAAVLGHTTRTAQYILSGLHLEK